MSDKFRITKPTGATGWLLLYPRDFDPPAGGIVCPSFRGAVYAFIEASERQCPSCGRGAVEDTPTGWECQNCGNFDTAASA